MVAGVRRCVNTRCLTLTKSSTLATFLKNPTKTLRGDRLVVDHIPVLVRLVFVSLVASEDYCRLLFYSDILALITV